MVGFGKNLFYKYVYKASITLCARFNCMKNLFLKFRKLNNFSLYNLGLFFFYFAVFLLPSAVVVSIVFFLISNIIISILNKQNFFQDKINFLLFILSILMLISSSIQVLSGNFISSPLNFDINSLSFLTDLGNWLPLFWCFWCWQHYLDSPSKRKIFALSLISGSIPFLITGIGQFHFDWYGPMETLFGTIKWYQRPTEIFTRGGLTGLFNNANYAGCWLNIIFPFCLASLVQSKKRNSKIISLITTFIVFYCNLLTNSRAAWISIFISIFLMVGIKKIKYILFFVSTTFFIVFSSANPILGNKVQQILQSLIPSNISMEFSNSGFNYLNVSRLDIWKSSLNYILNKPLFGSGANSFTAQFLSETSFFKAHSHNLFLELSISYGLPVSILLFGIIVFLIFKSIKNFYSLNIDFNKINFDRALISSSLVLFILQTVDITLFDGRIIIVFWILLAGLRSMLRQNELT